MIALGGDGGVVLYLYQFCDGYTHHEKRLVSTALQRPQIDRGPMHWAETPQSDFINKSKVADKNKLEHKIIITWDDEMAH